MRTELHKLISKATKNAEMFELGGYQDNPNDTEEPRHPLKQLKEELELALQQVNDLLVHSHDWNENDYCNLCGADGRA